MTLESHPSYRVPLEVKRCNLIAHDTSFKA